MLNLGIGGVFYIYEHTLPLQMASMQLSGKQERFDDCEKLIYNNFTKTITALWQKHGQTSVFSIRSPFFFFLKSCTNQSCTCSPTGSFPGEVFCDRTCPVRNIKYYLGCRKTAEA